MTVQRVRTLASQSPQVSPSVAQFAPRTALLSQRREHTATDATIEPATLPSHHHFDQLSLHSPTPSTPIQAKLTIGPAQDPSEQEADRVAQQVVQQIHQPSGEIVSAPAVSIQRQGSPSPTTASPATPDLERSIQAHRSHGQALPQGIRSPMEQAFGADFSRVRVHTDAQSDALNRSVQAQAFTTGQDVFFRQGAYSPSSRSGQALIAHELTHVVQQNPGTLQRSASPTFPSSSAPIIQRKNLTQAGLQASLGMKIEADKRKLVSDGRAVNVYYKSPSWGKDVDDTRTNIQALQTAAAINAQVGKTVDEYAAKPPLSARESNSKWTPEGTKLDSTGVNTIDPFFFEVTVSYDPNADGSREVMGFIYQHAKNWTGYVETIYDSSHADTQEIPTMYTKDPTNPSDTTGYAEVAADKDKNPKYTNVHDKTGSAKILDLVNEKGKKTEKNLDAYTKIAGEGARWQCVRNHAANLQDDSLFYTKISKTQVKGIDFNTLWLSWAGVFGKRYDIADSVVKAAILSNENFLKKPNGTATRTKLPATKNLASMSAKDYDLDTGKSHGT